MKLRFVLILGIVCAALASAFVPMLSSAADDLDRQQKALNIIADFADKLCKNIPLTGTSSGVELTGNAKAELKGMKWLYSSGHTETRTRVPLKRGVR